MSRQFECISAIDTRPKRETDQVLRTRVGFSAFLCGEKVECSGVSNLSVSRAPISFMDVVWKIDFTRRKVSDCVAWTYTQISSYIGRTSIGHCLAGQNRVTLHIAQCGLSGRCQRAGRHIV